MLRLGGDTFTFEAKKDGCCPVSGASVRVQRQSSLHSQGAWTLTHLGVFLASSAFLGMASIGHPVFGHGLVPDKAMLD